jgi:hypothetical protein
VRRRARLCVAPSDGEAAPDPVTTLVLDTRAPRVVFYALNHTPEDSRMLLVREIMYCKPGKVRALVDKFIAMNKLGERVGMPSMKIMTDFCAERYWTVVSEMEVENMAAFETMMSNDGGDAAAMKEMESIMKDYHDLVESGRREVYKIEGR